MNEYAKEYPNYLFEKNKGYGTKEHIIAIKNNGITPIHRRSFLKKYIWKIQEKLVLNMKN